VVLISDTMAVKFFMHYDGEKHPLGTLREGEIVESDEEGFKDWVENEKDLDTTPDFTDDDALINTYYGPSIVAEYVELEEGEDEVKDLSKSAQVARRSMGRGDTTYEEINDVIKDAYDNTVWWAHDEDDPDLSKSPSMWSKDVPDEAKQWVEAALDSNAIHGDYKDLPWLAPLNIERIFRRRLRGDAGFRVEDVVDDLQDTFPHIDEQRALNIARTETGAVLDTARELAHEAETQEKQQEEGENYEPPLYNWVGPNDNSTTEICSEVGKITKERGGVTLEQLKSLLREHARDSPSGTPNRVDDWSPHYQCRRTYERVN